LATLVDTSALFALLSADDENHHAAVEFVTQLAQERLVTSNYVVTEATALVQRRLGSDAARELHTALLRPIDVAWVDRETHDLAVAAFLAAPQVSLVDRVSFELMSRLRIRTAFAFDRDFAAHGFDVRP
jgi:uncharacterized protein